MWFLKQTSCYLNHSKSCACFVFLECGWPSEHSQQVPVHTWRSVGGSLGLGWGEPQVSLSELLGGQQLSLRIFPVWPLQGLALDPRSHSLPGSPSVEGRQERGELGTCLLQPAWFPVQAWSSVGGRTPTFSLLGMVFTFLGPAGASKTR